MDYTEALDFLYNSLPVFQRQGPGAYKPGLGTSLRLDEAFGHPHRKFRSIHIAGTNGKGSTAHTLAAMLQEAGYKTGLYTSPHLVDFRERIRVDGKMIPRDKVTDFVERYQSMNLGLDPSFFELTMTMAFEYFADCGVDFAVIEAGLGGRLDSTNIITPELSVITNISFDHTGFLGSTLPAIAGEKAGIIKEGVLVIIGEAPDDDVHKVFAETAAQKNAPIVFADEQRWWTDVTPDFRYTTPLFGSFTAELKGDCQLHNTATLLAIASRLNLPAEAVRSGFENVVEMTGLMGRWTVLSREPLIVTDTGHNSGGWQYLAPQIAKSASGTKHIVIGFVNDKDIDPILEKIAEIPSSKLYFTQPSVERARSAESLKTEAERFGLSGDTYPTVSEAFSQAKASAGPDDMIFVGGSNFIVADMLGSL